LQYGTTQTFLEHFGLRDLEDLPAVEELRRIEAKRQRAAAATAAAAPAETGTPPAATGTST